MSRREDILTLAMRAGAVTYMGLEDGRALSKNAAAEALLGRRPGAEVVIIDEPVELGYHCPVCVYEDVTDEKPDERLMWSEYNAFLWCVVCNRDYPSALCLPNDAARATNILLETVIDGIREFVERVEKRAESDIAAGNPIEGAHYRAMKAETQAAGDLRPLRRYEPASIKPDAAEAGQ